MSSVFDFLFQGSPPASVTSSTTSETGFPAWYQELLRANIGNATSVASQPYQAYTGPQVAPTTANQQQAWDMTKTNVGSANPSLNTASGALGQAAQGAASSINDFMNPYMTNVLDTIENRANRNLMENVLPGVNDTFTSAGQFGSTRNADFTNRAIRDNQQAISDAQSSALSTGYKNATDAALTNQSNLTQAGNALGTLGQVYQNVGLKDAAALDTVGQEQQAQTQKNYDAALNNFNNQNNYAQNQAQWLNNIIRGIAAPTTSVTNSINPSTAGGASGLSQAAATAAGTSGLSGLSSTSVAAPISLGK